MRAGRKNGQPDRRRPDEARGRNGGAGSRRMAVASALCAFVAVLGGVVPAARGDDGTQPGAWAVVIGIDHYANGENLQSARADAGDMNQVLAKDGIPPDHRLVLTDAQATGAGIRAAADWLTAHSTDSTTAVFFYAGHVDKLSSNTEALRGSDLVKVTDADLASHFRRLHARAAWFTIAGCFGGGFQELLGPGRILTAASGANELSYENEDFGRSYLDEYMIRRGMLQGAAGPNATLQTAFQYAADSLRRDYPNRVPLQWDDVGSPVDLRAPASPVAPPPPPPAPVATRPVPA